MGGPSCGPGAAFSDEREPAEGFAVSGCDDQLTCSAGDQPSRAAGDVLDDADDTAAQGGSAVEANPDMGLSSGPSAGFEEKLPARFAGQYLGVIVDDGGPYPEGVVHFASRFGP